MNPSNVTLALLVAATTLLSAADQPIRVAVGPYFAPPQKGTIEAVANALPDLVTAELAGNSRFQLVERAQVDAVVKELHLSAEGFTSAETVLKLGKLLSADWLISGLVAPSRTSTQLWTKVIDMRSGIVLDLQSTPLSSDVAASVIEIGKQISATTRPNRMARQYVALGPFRDYSVTPGRPDWSRELQSLLERRLREQGFGVVEREAIGMISQELDLSGKGLTTPQTNKVRLQSAFWLIDGGSRWLDGGGSNLNVMLRMQKVGGAGTFLRLTNAAGAVMDQAITNAVFQAMLAANSPKQNGTAADEARIQAATGEQLARARDPFGNRTFDNGRSDLMEVRRDNLRMAVQRYEAAVALNPNDLDAKFMLGAGLTGDPETIERGKKVLWEIVNKNDPKYSPAALGRIAIAELFDVDPVMKSRTGFRPGDVECQVRLLTNSADLDAKLQLGTSLLGFAMEQNRKRGVSYLEEVAASSRADLAPKAQKSLADYKKIPPGRKFVPMRPPGAIILDANNWRQRYDLAKKSIDSIVPYRTDPRMIKTLGGDTNDLWQVIAHGDSELQKLAKDALAEAQDKYLWLAMEADDPKAALAAIANGARTESTNEYGMTALINTVHETSDHYRPPVKHRIEMAEALISAGANVNARTATATGSPVLSWATETDDPALLEFLISKGAEVDGKSHNGDTALYMAVVNGRFKSAECLLKHGADPNLKSFRGKSGILYSPLSCAQTNDATEMVKLLTTVRPAKR